jgi:hypothetical protein
VIGFGRLTGGPLDIAVNRLYQLIKSMPAIPTNSVGARFGSVAFFSPRVAGTRELRLLLNALQNKALAVLCLAAFGSLGWSSAIAHGALSMDEDACKLAVGPYFMHFTGYQPSSAGNQEFCEDIPNIGQTIIVLDSIDDILREMEIEIRVIQDIPGVVDPQGDDVIYQPFRNNSRGSITVMHSFAQKGPFVGLVSARRGDEQYTARFPFSVGMPPPASESASGGVSWLYTAGAAAIVLLIAGVLVARRRKAQGTPSDETAGTA